MIFKNSKEQPLQNPEVVLNLWAYADDAGLIMRVAGKTYVMQGSDADKLSLLRALSATDFMSAQWDNVPKRFNISGPDGREMSGVATVSNFSDPHEHSLLFGPLIEKLAKSIPEQVASYGGEYKKIRLDLPQNPLMISTIVIEYDDGRLVPVIKKTGG